MAPRGWLGLLLELVCWSVLLKPPRPHPLLAPLSHLQTLEMQNTPAEQPAAPYTGAVPFQGGARGVAAAPPPKRRY